MKYHRVQFLVAIYTGVFFCSFQSTMYSLRFCDVPRHRSHQLGSAVRTTLQVLRWLLRCLYLRWCVLRFQRLVLEGFDMGIMRATIERTVALFRQNLEENPEEGCTYSMLVYISGYSMQLYYFIAACTIGTCWLVSIVLV